jgi:hypothetical protein
MADITKEYELPAVPVGRPVVVIVTEGFTCTVRLLLEDAEFRGSPL